MAFLPPPSALGGPLAGVAAIGGGRPQRRYAGGSSGWAVRRRATGAPGHRPPPSVAQAAPNDGGTRSPAVGGTPAPPLIRGRSLAVSYTAAATAAAAAITAAAATGATRLTIDVPPSRAESRAGTLVGRYEADLSFASALLVALGAVEGAGGWARVGEDVEIRHCVNPQGGGDYLTEEGLWGVVGETSASGLGGTVTVLGNAGVDVSALAGVADAVASSPPGGVVILLNGGLSRVTWLDRLGWRRGRGAVAAALDAFVPAYALARIGGDVDGVEGAGRGGGGGGDIECVPVLVGRGGVKPSVSDADAAVKRGVAVAS
ncbi:hypothetical protein MMPV_007202 [Pyropia vietnamensis]